MDSIEENAVPRISRLAPTDADELLAFVRRLQRDDALRPVTVVAPSNYARLSLQHGLGRSGFANMQFIVFDRLAELLGAPSLVARGKRPLTSIFDSAVVRAVASEATGMLEPLRDHPATHLSLRQTFRQLRHATDDALERLSEQSGLRAETVALYRKYRERTRDFYDDEDLAEAAAAAVRDGSAHGLQDLGFIVFFRVRGLTPAQRLLAKALTETERCAMLLGLTGDNDADESTRALANELYPHHSLPPKAEGTPLPSSPHRKEILEGDEEVDKGIANGSPHLLIAPDAHQEVRWVIRRIVRRAEAGTPFHRMAALYRKDAPYGTLIREELTLAGIPVAGPNTSSLADTAVGRTLTGLLSLSEGEFARDAVMAWLTGCPLNPPDIKASEFSASLWDAISRRAGVVRGIAQWQERLEQFAANMEQGADEGLKQDERTGARAYRMRSEAFAARGLLRFVRRLAAHTAPPDTGDWSAYSDWASALLERYLASKDLPDDEQRAYVRILDILDELKSAAEIQRNATYDMFRRALNEALQDYVGHVGSVGHGVFVAPVRIAAAMSFDVVHIVGMIEGAMPPAVPDDPLIPDRERERAGGAAAGLPLRQQRKADERYDYLAALATAPEHTLSYPVADPAGQRGNFPSRWLLEQASELENRPLFTSDLEKFKDTDRPWLTKILSMERSLDTARSITHADAHDLNMEQLRGWQASGRGIARHALAHEGVFAASLRLTDARQGDKFTEWDGNLGVAVVDTGIAESLGNRALSPTSLERWAKCPFSYFLGSILRLSAEERPEDIYTITPLEKGLLIHRILEDFVKDARKNGALPQGGAAWSAAHRSKLRHIADKAFADAETRGVVGKALMWQIAKDEMRIDLEAFLDADTDMRRRHGVSPLSVEATFGRQGAGGWQAARHELPDGTQVAFRGMIDRIDADADRKRVLVLDYKTGSNYGYTKLKDDPIDRGQRLQLAIYSLAAQQAFGSDANVSAAYWFVTGRGGFRLLPEQPIGITDDNVRERFQHGISTIVDGIRDGLFPANPGPVGRYGFENCGWCDFKTLCPSQRDVQWRRKSSAPQLADYVNLNQSE